MRYKVNSFDYLKSRLAELTDDPAKHWSEYPCLLWDRGISGGYGTLWIVSERKTFHVHRVAFELTHGKLPPHIVACHHCDTPACFRPQHIFGGTQGDNMRDCKNKGRMPHDRTNTRGPNHWTAKRGLAKKVRVSTHPRCKLTDELVREIRSLSGLDHVALGERFNVTRSNISYILSGKTWKHVV